MRPGDRSSFPSLRWRVYANHAAIGPLPAPAVAAMERVARAQATDGVGAVGALFAERDRARDEVAALLEVPAEDVALVTSTSAGVSAIAACLSWRSGDRIICFDGEFPTNVTPWQLAAAHHGLGLTLLPVDALTHDGGRSALRAELARGRVRVVAVSAVQFDTGSRMPLGDIAALAHDHGAEVFVDAIQALGALPFDASEVDYVAAGGQKWLMGPVGTGLLYTRAALWERLVPRLASWMSHVDPLAFLWGDPDKLVYDRPLRAGPALVEGGAPNLAGAIALGAAVALHRAVGTGAIHAHANRWIDALEPELVALGFTSHRSAEPLQRSTILSLSPPPGVHAGAFVTALGGRGVSASSPNGRVRFSPSWPNALGEVPVVVAAAADALRELA